MRCFNLTDDRENVDKNREEPSGCVKIRRRRRIVRLLRSADGLNIGEEERKLFRENDEEKT